MIGDNRGMVNPSACKPKQFSFEVGPADESGSGALHDCEMMQYLVGDSEDREMVARVTFFESPSIGTNA